MYKNMLTKWLIKNGIQNISISQFSSYHAQKFMDDLILEKKIKNITYNTKLTGYRAIFNFFVQRELIEQNPFKKINRLKVEDAKIVAFSEIEWEILYNNLPIYDPRLWIIANLIYYAALRPIEIMRLKFENIDLLRQKISSLGINSKNKKNQIIEIPDELQQLLDKTNWDYPKEYFIFSNSLKPGIKGIVPNSIHIRWKKFATKFNIKERTIYNLKHNAAGRLIDAVFNARDIQMHFRHSTLSQTAQYIEKFRSVSSERLKHNFPSFISNNIEE